MALVEADCSNPGEGRDKSRNSASGPALGRSFWSFWTAAAVSNVGDGFALVAFPLLATGLTDNAGLVAGVVFAQRLPWLLLALPAGALADRLNRGRAMGLVDLTRAGVLLAVVALTASDAMSLPALYLAGFALGSLETLFAAASHAAVPALVGDGPALDRANGYLFATETAGSELAGPALGGLLFAASTTAPFATDAVSFVVSAVLLLKLRHRLPAPASPERRPSLRSDIAAGVRFFRGHRTLRPLGTLVCGLAFCQSMVMGILVLFGIQVLGLSDMGYGLFLAAGAIGSVIGGLLAGRVRAAMGDTGVLLGSAALAAAAYLVVAATTSPFVAVLAFVAETFAVGCGSVASISLRQALVPDALRGRVGNVFRMLIWGVIPLGALAGGLVAEFWTLSGAIAAAGALQGVIVLATARRLSQALHPPQLTGLATVDPLAA